MLFYHMARVHAVRVSGFPNFQKSGYPGIQISEYSDFRIPENPEIRISEFPKLLSDGARNRLSPNRQAAKPGGLGQRGVLFYDMNREYQNSILFACVILSLLFHCLSLSNLF